MTTYLLRRPEASAAPAPTLDASQQAVVDHVGGPLLVLAGPGTGKTTTMVEAVVDLVERRGVDPAEILALTFSRAPLPWARDAFAKSRDSLPEGVPYRRHIGMYAYRVGFLQDFVSWGPCWLEQTEALEQLRALWHGVRIHVADAIEAPAVGVDTPEDLERVRRLLEA